MGLMCLLCGYREGTEQEDDGDFPAQERNHFAPLHHIHQQGPTGITLDLYHPRQRTGGSHLFQMWQSHHKVDLRDTTQIVNLLMANDYYCKFDRI